MEARQHISTTHFTIAKMPPLRLSVDALMHQYGTWPVIAMAITGIFRAAIVRRELAEMSDHMRQDIGLPRGEEPMRPRESMW